MSEPPPLPPSDDPFELLGVPPDCEMRALKSAYARLIKTYRPDRSPEEFRRIQQAFEVARDHLERQEAWPEAEAEDEVEPDEDAAAWAALTEGREHVSAEELETFFRNRATRGDPPLLTRAREAFTNEDAAAGRALLEQAVREHPGDPRVEVFEAAVLRELGELPPEKIRTLAANLRRGSAHVERIEFEGATELLDLVALVDEMTAPAIVTCLSGYPAFRTLSERCQHRLIDGRWDELVTELLDPAVAESLHEQPQLAAALLRTACALAWLSPADGRRLHEIVSDGSIPAEGTLEDRYLERSRLEPLWRRWHEEHPELAPFSRLLLLEDSIDEEQFNLLLRELRRLMDADPRGFLRRLDELCARDEGLGLLYGTAIEARLDDPEDDALDESRSNQVVAFLRSADFALGNDFLGDLNFKLILVFLVLTLAFLIRPASMDDFAFFRDHGLLLAGGSFAIALLLFFFGTRVQDRRLYSRHVRPRALRLVKEIDVTPQQITVLMKRYEKGYVDVSRFQLEMGHDFVLHLVARTRSLIRFRLDPPDESTAPD